MRTRILLLPEALVADGEEPLFDSSSPVLQSLLERAQWVRIANRPAALPEAAWLGLKPSDGAAAQGPLMASALKADPPDRAVVFHLSLLSHQNGQVARPMQLPTAAETQAILRTARKLETPRLTLVDGVALDHALVWERGSLELGCRTPEELLAKGLWASLPEGDGAPMLRRFIDDSVNLLSELEGNRIREQEGFPPFNLLWPWAPGFRPELPNLTLRRSASVRVESPSFRLAGLCRWVGYRHGDPWGLGRGTNLRLEAMTASALESPYWLGVIPTLGEFRREERDEEARWLGREILERLLQPLLRESSSQARRIVLIATTEEGFGLAADYRTDRLPHGQSGRFDAEAASRRDLPLREMSDLIEEALTA